MPRLVVKKGQKQKMHLGPLHAKQSFTSAFFFFATATDIAFSIHLGSEPYQLARKLNGDTRTAQKVQPQQRICQRWSSACVMAGAKNKDALATSTKTSAGYLARYCLQDLSRPRKRPSGNIDQAWPGVQTSFHAALTANCERDLTPRAASATEHLSHERPRHLDSWLKCVIEPYQTSSNVVTPASSRCSFVATCNEAKAGGPRIVPSETNSEYLGSSQGLEKRSKWCAQWRRIMTPCVREMYANARTSKCFFQLC